MQIEKNKQEIYYKIGTELHEYPEDSIVIGVPVEYFDNDKDAIEYYEKNKNKESWKKSTQAIIDNFDIILFDDFFYCSKCRRLEDGAHRRIIALDKGRKKVNVMVGSDCYKNYVKDGRLIRSDSTFIDTILKTMKDNPTEHRLDRKWLMASAGDKWSVFSGKIDFRGKSVLDVGCNVGYSCFRAWGRMVANVTGIDIREDILKIPKIIKKKLILTNDRMQFLKKDWNKYKVNRKYDIVISMGLLHYFSMTEYEAAFDKLMDSCKETLVIEMRLRTGNHNSELTAGSGNQTLPTEGWLSKKLETNNFKVITKYDREPGLRSLWVARKVEG